MSVSWALHCNTTPQFLIGSRCLALTNKEAPPTLFFNMKKINAYRRRIWLNSLCKCFWHSEDTVLARMAQDVGISQNIFIHLCVIRNSILNEIGSWQFVPKMVYIFYFWQQNHNLVRAYLQRPKLQVFVH